MFFGCCCRVLFVFFSVLLFCCCCRGGGVFLCLLFLRTGGGVFLAVAAVRGSGVLVFSLLLLLFCCCCTTAQTNTSFTAFLSLRITYFSRMLDVSGTRHSVTSIRIQNAAIYGIHALSQNILHGLAGAVTSVFSLCEDAVRPSINSKKPPACLKRVIVSRLSAKTWLFQEIWLLPVK